MSFRRIVVCLLLLQELFKFAVLLVQRDYLLFMFQRIFCEFLLDILLLFLAHQELLHVLHNLLPLADNLVVEEQHIAFTLLDQKLISVVLQGEVVVEVSEFLGLFGSRLGVHFGGSDGVHVDVKERFGL